jgi:hypothetical protein
MGSLSLIGDVLIAPYKLLPRLSGASYLRLITEELPQLLEDVQLAMQYTMWFMHDGAPAHFVHDVKQVFSLITQING